MVDPARDRRLREAIELLYFGYRAFTAPPDRLLQRRGLGRVHHRILYFVGRNPGIAVGGLLATLGISKQALHAPLRELTAMRLVASRPGRADRRVRCLELTAGGRALESRITRTQLELLASVFEETGSGAETAWRRVMAALAARQD